MLRDASPLPARCYNGTMKNIFRRYLPSWEWFVLLGTLILLTLFVLGIDFFGLNGALSSLFALGGALATTLIAFIMAALIGPLIALVTALIGGVIAALGAIVATLIMPIVALGTGLFTTVVGWLAGTWVGAMFTPIYTMVAPIILKISPLLTMGKYGHKFYDWLDDHSWWPKQLVFTANRRQKAALTKGRKIANVKAKAAARKRRR